MLTSLALTGKKHVHTSFLTSCFLLSTPAACCQNPVQTFHKHTAAAAAPRQQSLLCAPTATQQHVGLLAHKLNTVSCNRLLPCSPKGWYCPGGDYSGLGAPNRTQCPDFMTTVGKRSVSQRACGKQLVPLLTLMLACRLQADAVHDSTPHLKLMAHT